MFKILKITRAKPATPVFSRLRRPNHRSVEKGRERQKNIEISTLLSCSKSKKVFRLLLRLLCHMDLKKNFFENCL